MPKDSCEVFTTRFNVTVISLLYSPVSLMLQHEPFLHLMAFVNASFLPHHLLPERYQHEFQHQFPSTVRSADGYTHQYLRAPITLIQGNYSTKDEHKGNSKQTNSKQEKVYPV